MEKVQLPINVTCLLNRSLLTSNVTSPPSPTKQAFPQVLTHLTECDLAEGEEDASIDALTPSPLVWSFISVYRSKLSAGFIIMSAPNSIDLFNLCLLVSRAIILAPMLWANITADKPTGPIPNIAIV